MVVKGKAYCLTASYNGAVEKNSVERKQRTMVLSKREEDALRDVNDKARCMLSSMYKGSQSNGMTLVNTGKIRKLTPVECERLQGLPDNYTEGIANTNRYKVLGNAFNVDVIAHILLAICPFCDQDETRCTEPH